MTEKRIARLLGGHEVTLYPTAFGEFSRSDGADGPRVRLLGFLESGSPCSHYATAEEARDAAAALLEIAGEIEGRQPRAAVHNNHVWAFTGSTPDHPARAHGPLQVTE